jgi:parvulin-like peptidyl-prolyl isomerase
MAKVLREPLFHFLLAGLALFLLYELIRGGESDAPREIVISEARVEALAESFAAVWMRPPTPQEIKGLVDDFVAEEIFYREGIAMGLDQDDTVIRRRLRQKMEFIAEDAATAVEPSDEQLQAYLAQHAAKFVAPAELTFAQVYFNTGKRGDSARAEAEKLLAELQAGRGPADPAEAGDPTLLPVGLQAASPQAIANAFGSDFAAQIEEAPVGQWSGPLQSTFGLHLVRVDERTAGALPALEAIRPIVLREWQAEQRTASNQRFLDGLRARYEVRIEGPAAVLFEPAAGGKQGQ